MTDAGSVRGPLGGWEQFVARGDELVRVEVSNTEIAVVVEAPKGEVLARTAIPYPTAGCGGYEILLSAKERYLAMFLYSGQSEVDYELFYFRPHCSIFPPSDMCSVRAPDPCSRPMNAGLP